MINENFEKQKISVRYWLQGRGYFKALKAMDFASKLHTGKRKDGSHEFSHQISQVSYIKTLVDSLLFPEDTICTIFLHDTSEDYDVPFVEIEKLFGTRVRNAVFKMTKVYRGEKKDIKVYYSDMLDCEIASVAKGVDRIHNHLTMLNGFKPEKQKSYILETMEHIIPVIKSSRRRFPEQEPVYENIKFVLLNQIRLYDELTKHTIKEETK